MQKKEGNIFMKKLIGILLILCLMGGMLTGCALFEEDVKSPVQGKKVAYIMHMEQSEIFEMWSESAKATAEELGMEYDAVFCNGSDDEWKKQVESYAANGYDGLLLSHGGQSYAYTFLKEIQEKYPDLKIVTFDTQFLDESGQKQTLDGVTQFFQQDAMLAELLLDYISDTLYADKMQAKEPVNILKVWKGPGYLSAFDRREVGYAKYEKNGTINTLETIAPSDVNNAEESVYLATKEALSRYESGEIDAIWCCYDLYANGVYRALKEGGYDIPLLSVDICNADIAKMEEEGSPWKACATSNWYFNGKFGIRALALEMTGEYDKIIDPLTNQASNWLELPAKLITQDMVTADNKATTVADLQKFISTSPEWMISSDWIDRLAE